MAPRFFVNTYAGNPLDRRSELRIQPDHLAELWAAPNCRVLAFWNGQPLTAERDGGLVLPALETGLASEAAMGAGDPVFLGLDGEAAVWAIELTGDADPAQGPLQGRGEFVDLRMAGGRLSSGDAGVATGEPPAGHAQVDELPASLERALGGIGVAGQLDGPYRSLAIQAQEHRVPGAHRRLRRQSGLQRGQDEAAVPLGGQRLAVPERQHPAVRRGPQFGQVVRLDAQLAASIQGVAGIGVDEEARSHGASLAAGAFQAKRACVMSSPYFWPLTASPEP